MYINNIKDKEPGIIYIWFDSLNKTRSLFYIEIHEAKDALLKDVCPINRVDLTVLVSVKNICILGIA